MRQNAIIAVFILFMSGLSFGQSTAEAQKREYRIADSLNAVGKISQFDTTIYKIADSLNNCHPIGYFNVAAELLNQSKFNEAAFLYYLGNLRFRYYNSVNPDYQPSGDGALFASLKSVMGDPINIYQRINIDNFISVLKRVTKYTSENDYKFYSRDKNIEKYNNIIEKWNNQIIDMETNKEKYSAEWNNDRINYEKKLDVAIEENKKKAETETHGK